MAASRAHDWLGLEDHDGDSDAESVRNDDLEESRTAGVSRSTKRRKVDHSSSSDGENDDDSDGEDDDDDASADESTRGGVSLKTSQKPTKSDNDDDHDDNDDDDGADDDGNDGEAHTDQDEDGNDLSLNPTSKKSKKPSLKPLTSAELEATRAAVRKTGVVYLSRIPPFMRPQKVKALLSRFGEIGRIFLTPEDAKSHALRTKFGGSKKKNFEEGWVEFMDKRIAKVVAETLNTKIIGGKKGSYYHDDVWNIKYLPKFKWHHLQAQIAYENASRQAKMRAEIAQATRENKTFVRNVERAKMVENMKETKKRKLADQSSKQSTNSKSKDKDTTNNASSTATKEEIEVRRQFRQNKTKGQKAAQAEGAKTSESMKRVLGKIF